MKREILLVNILIYRIVMYICSMYSKELLKGTISAIILKLLSEKEKMYGYEICMVVKELSDGKILLKDGSLYPALQKMTSDGLLSFKEETVGGRVRKYYYITKQGQKQKAAYVEELKDFISTMNKVVFPEFKTYETFI
ncbi:MAG TPA: helix-turn-helix transcriptional regulator [Chryseolinea sp.]|nr:helix-turn-helix transcriptional regulator [Chryseolinea sp.]